MATPNWDIIHVRFASSVRDSVSSAATNGDELLVADRDAYLNFAYEEYIRLLHVNNPGAVNLIIPELSKTQNISAGSGIANLPSDFGYLANLVDTSNISAQITYLDINEFEKMRRVSDTHFSPPSADSIQYTIKANLLYLLPATSDSFDITYIVKALNITQGGSNDLVLLSNHWDSIVNLAKVKYLNDKQEYDASNLLAQRTILNAPFNIGKANGN